MASIIKAGGPIKGGPEIRTQQFNLTNIQDQADGYLGDVRQQAEQIVAAANEQARQIRDEARQQGISSLLDCFQLLGDGVLFFGRRGGELFAQFPLHAI